MMTEPLMTPLQVAEYIAQKFAVSKRHVYDRWEHTTGFPKPILLIGMGKRQRKRYAKSDIDRWIEEQQKSV